MVANKSQQFALCHENMKNFQFDEALGLMQGLIDRPNYLNVFLGDISRYPKEQQELFKNKAIERQIFKNPFIDYYGDSLLNRLCQNSLDVVLTQYDFITELLILGGADVNFKGKDSRTPLMQSLASQTPNIETLLKHQAEVHHKETDEQFVLFIAAIRSNSKEIELLLQYGAPINAQNKNGTTALLKAALFGGAEQVTCLLKNGANIHLQDDKGCTVLQTLRDLLHKSTPKGRMDFAEEKKKWMQNLAIIENHQLYLDITGKPLPLKPATHRL